MKVIEIVKMGQKMLEIMQSSCIKVNDVKYVELYDEYLRMKSDGMKMTYIITSLSERYHVSERKIYYIIERFGKECRIGA